jgi:hypothetical protein
MVQISDRRPAILTKAFRGFSRGFPGECWGSTLKFGHDRFVPNPFQFIVHYYCIIRRKIVLVTEKSVVK